VSDDDIAQLKRMRDRGEITGAQYETLRRHVLWGTPLPEAVESLTAATEEDPPPPWQPYVPGGRRAEQRPAANPWPSLDEPTEQYRPIDQPKAGRHAARSEPTEPYQPPYQQPGPQQPGPQQPGYPHAGHYTGPASGSFPPQTGDYTGPPSGAVPPQTGHYTGPPSGSFAPQTGHYTGPPSGAVPPQTGHYTGPPSGAVPAYTGPPSGSFPAVGAYTGPATGAQPAIGPERARRPVPELPGKAAPRRRRGRGTVAFLLSVLLAVVLAGAGVWWFVLRQTGVAPGDYARGVCGKVQTWHDDVTARSGELQQALNSNAAPEATRGALATFFDQVASRTRQLRTDVDGVGVPSIAAGQSYVDGLDKKLDDTAAAFSGSAQRARALDINNPATFEINTQVLQSQVDQQITGVTGALAGTNTPGELRTAYNNASECAPFTG
jgi:hypothetical protein